MALASVVVACTAVATGYGALLALVVWQKGYPREHMDWNADGEGSLLEFFASSDIGAREAISQPGCIDYYSLKDGMTVKVMCPESDRR